jgi:endonuclease/exonuclease/phosphatase (EEP) superfamily protein YafD
VVEPGVVAPARGRAARWTEVLGWLVLAPLGGVALARLVAWDARSVLIGLNAVTPVVFLPAWAVAVLAGAFRRWALLAGAGVLVVVHAALVLPELRAAEGIPQTAFAAPRIRLFDANVFVDNTDVAGYVDEIEGSRPDVVVLQEATPAFVAGLDAAGALDALPYRRVVTRTDPSAALVASRFPLTADDVVEVEGRPVLMRATMAVEGHPIRLFAVHAVAPVGGGRHEWTADLAAVGRAVAAEPGPVLVAGDFNATWGNRSFRRLLDRGLTDAAAARGDAWQMTWPRNRHLLPPVARIDHVLTRGPLVVTHIGTGTGHGSDHRPLVAEVALLPSA